MKIERGLLFLAFLLGLICCYSFQNENYTFRCHRGDYKYIRDGDFCNGNDDCDYEDERLGCIRKGRHACGAGKFSCDGECKSITVRCNTIKDCQDDTDELDCGDEINVKNCTSEDKFLCKDGLRCLGIEHTCDDKCNCFDCSDENSNCSKNDFALLKECPHAYFRTVNGPQCFCESNITSSSNSTLCSDITYCDQFIERRCDQRCIQFKTKVQCSCYEGYHPMNELHGTHCKTKDDNFRIIYATEFEIKSLNNTSHKTSTILHGIANCTQLKAANNYVYYATLSHDNKGRIFKTEINSGKAEKLIETSLPITSMAVDYITNNVYFTSNGSLSVCGSNGRLCMQLKCCNVTYVTLAPKSGWMFYLQVNTHQDSLRKDGYYLSRSNMDGSNETMRTGEYQYYLGHVSMEIDESKNQLYMLSQYDYSERLEQEIHEIMLDSEFVDQHYYVELSVSDSLRHWRIEHFSFYGSELFFTSRTRADIFYLSRLSHYLWYDIDTGNSPPVYLHDNTSSAITGLYVYNAAIQLSDENPCDDKSSCSGLCLLKPDVGPSKYFLSHSCFCDDSTAPDNNPRCSKYDSEPAEGTSTFTCILLLLLLILLVAGTGYFLLKKRHWYRWR